MGTRGENGLNQIDTSPQMQATTGTTYSNKDISPVSRVVKLLQLNACALTTVTSKKGPQDAPPRVIFKRHQTGWSLLRDQLYGC